MYLNSSKKNIISIVFLFLVWFGFGQNTEKQELLKLKELALESLSKNDTLARSYANKMLEIANANQVEVSQGEALFLKAKSLEKQSSFKALENYKLATPFLEAAKHEWLTDVYYNQSNINTLYSEFPEALELALKSLEYNQLQNQKSKMQRDMSYIGYIHDRMYEFRESMKWNRKALKLAIALKDQNAQAVCYGRIGIAYDELAEKDNFNKKLFDSALYYNLKAARLSEQSGDLGFSRTTYSNIGNSFSKLKQYDKAEEYTLKSLNVPGFEERKGVTLVNLGKIYLETGRYLEAKKILDSAMSNTIKYGTRKYQLEAYYRFHELDVKKGNYKSALQNYIKYKNVEDSLLNETKTKQIVEVSERYKTAEKEREILSQRAHLAEQELHISRKNTQIIGLVCLAIMLSILGYLLYKQQKLKHEQLKKESKLKEALIKIETQNKLQEQRLRISRDLHDNIGAQLTFIISSLDNLKYQFKLPEPITEKLKSITTFTTATIYELRDTIWAMNKSKITLEDLQSRISNFVDKANLVSPNVNFQFNAEETSKKHLQLTSIQGMNIYRIMQEAVNNALKYAQASRIDIYISSPKNKIKINILDNGVGFNINKVALGNGINNMKKRAQEINAQIKIESNLDQGTSVKLTL